MIPNGKEMNWNGHKLVFKKGGNPCSDCQNDYDCPSCKEIVSGCDKCFFGDMAGCPECDVDGIWVEVENGSDS